MLISIESVNLLLDNLGDWKLGKFWNMVLEFNIFVIFVVLEGVFLDYVIVFFKGMNNFLFLN